ncbi:LAMI_0E00936g1_1 [Lachancea mirantina]|uniref:ATPase expression protein 1 n=1 Tax=Lachancea mirantina TaxID=1230905 RepID=A0A1G4JID8_9SACH|nr:LAMI_0E00936g1_1 [Lachancea mirantina]
MTKWKLQSKRFLSLGADMKAIGSIPKNQYKHDNNSPFCRSNHVVPQTNDLNHAFYSPNVAECVSLCMTEVRPSLLDGLPVMPAIITHPKNLTKILVNARCEFDTVRGVSKWITDLREKSVNANKLAIIEANSNSENVRPTKLNLEQKNQLEQALFDASGATKPSLRVGKILQGLENLQNRSNDQKLFSEEVFLCLMQDYCRSESDLIAILNCAAKFLTIDIDQVAVAELILLQALYSIEKFDSQPTPELASSVTQFLHAIGDRFNAQHYLLCQDAKISQELLKFMVSVNNLNDSKFIMSDLIGRGLCPNKDLIETYLNLVDSAYPSKNNRDQILRRFAYISDFLPVFRTVLSPKIVHHLISNCRHFNEVGSLLELIESSDLSDTLLTESLPHFIERVGSLTRDKLQNSIGLNSLYHRVINVRISLPLDDIQREFAMQFALNDNFSMVGFLLNEIQKPPAPQELRNLLGAINQKSDGAINVVGFNKHSRQQLENIIKSAN